MERTTASGLLQKNAVAARSRWRFETEIVSGVAVEPRMSIPFGFSPERRAGPLPECTAGRQ